MSIAACITALGVSGACALAAFGVLQIVRAIGHLVREARLIATHASRIAHASEEQVKRMDPWWQRQAIMSVLDEPEGPSSDDVHG